MQPEKIGKTLGSPDEKFGIQPNPAYIYPYGESINPSENQLPLQTTESVANPTIKSPQTKTWPDGPKPPDNKIIKIPYDPNRLPDNYFSKINKIVADSVISANGLVNEAKQNKK